LYGLFAFFVLFGINADLILQVLPFASVFGTLFFIFLIGFVLNQMNTAEANNKRRRQSNRAGNEEFSGNAPASASNSKTAEGKDQVFLGNLNYR
jgi:hypothetical protein